MSNLKAKIGRAYAHLLEFDALVVNYCRSNPYTVSEEDDLVNQRHIVRCDLNPMTADIYLSLADVIYALRSGLDQMAWGLALLGSPTPSRDVMFPIFGEKPDARGEDRFRKIVWDMPCEAVAIIKELQPYNRGTAYRDHPLWQLNELSNIDKHRVPAGRATIASIYAEPAGFIQRELDNGVELSWPLSMKEAVVLKPNVPEPVFGDPFNSALPFPLELTREQIARIYSFVREEVKPRFARFFPALPEAE